MMATRLADLDVDLVTRGHLERGLEHLSEEFAGTFSAATVERYEDWEVEDPAENDLEGVRRIRDDISRRVRTLLAELTAPFGAGR